MNSIVNFIKVFWKEILSICLFLLSILISCFRKRPVKVVDTLKEVIVRVLPSLIISAEATGLKGSDKMKWLLDELARVLRELHYGDDVIAQYLPFAMDQVELILSCPQKKGNSK